MKTLIPYPQPELGSLFTWVFKLECYNDLCSHHSLKYYFHFLYWGWVSKKLPFKLLWNSVQQLCMPYILQWGILIFNLVFYTHILTLQLGCFLGTWFIPYALREHQYSALFWRYSMLDRYLLLMITGEVSEGSVLGWCTYWTLHIWIIVNNICPIFFSTLCLILRDLSTSENFMRQ